MNDSILQEVFNNLRKYGCKYQFLRLNPKLGIPSIKEVYFELQDIENISKHPGIEGRNNHFTHEKTTRKCEKIFSSLEHRILDIWFILSLVVGNSAD